MTGVQQIEIAADEAEQRLDRWFRRNWPHIGQGRIEKMCRKGAIRVDGKRAKASTRVGPGQIVRVPPIPEAEGPPASPVGPTHIDASETENLLSAIVYRDDHLIVLNKPPGLAVQGGSKQQRHLGGYLPHLAFGREDVPRLVHRLDKDTSGLLVLGRTGVAASALGRLFRSRDVEKIYYAAVAGRPQADAGTIRYGLEKSGQRGDERMHVVHPREVGERDAARHAVTDYQVIEQAAGRMAWVAMRPVTGRTHQLRAHMAAIGCPILGDGKYGGRGQENLGDGWGAGIGGALSRKLHLHAAKLSFRHPVTEQRMTFRAPLPEHMQRTWHMLGWSEAEVPEDLLERAR